MSECPDNARADRGTSLDARSHSKRGLRHSWSNRVMLAATLAMYALSTLDWAIDVRLLWNDLRTLRFFGLPDAGRFGRSSPPLLVIQGITSVVCVSDSPLL